MIIIIGSKIGKNDIKQSLGKPEYSYYFLLKEFLPALEAIGKVIVAQDVESIDRIYKEHHSRGEQVVFLSFTPPHQTPLELDCPTVCVFAWEFDSIPTVAWENDQRNDWRYVFSRIAGTITTSKETFRLISEVMQNSIPVMALPAPVWNKYGSEDRLKGQLPQLDARSLTFSGTAIDSPILGLSADGLVRKHVQPEAPPPPAPTLLSKNITLMHNLWQLVQTLYRNWQQEFSLPFYALPDSAIIRDEKDDDENTGQKLILRGVVYCTVLNPADGRKNWIDIVTAFCWAFKETEDATLLVKMTHHDLEHYRIVLMTLLSRLAPFKCRVIVLHAYLNDQQYTNLVEASTYYVNASFCEGLCIPLLEFLSSGKPAVAPRHTAMADYVNDDCAVLLHHTIEPNCWPHDPTGMLHTHRHRISWESLESAYRESYIIATKTPDKYRLMSANAAKIMKDYSQNQTVSKNLLSFLQSALRRRAPAAKREAAQ